RKRGKIKSCGVSNYGVHPLKELLDSKPEILHEVNQVELHPFLQGKDIEAFCVEHGIRLEGITLINAGCSVCAVDKRGKIEYSILIGIVEKCNRTAAQILIRYNLQK